MSSATSVVMPFVPVAAAPAAAAAVATRFTLDGDNALEAHLAGICSDVREGIGRLIPSHRLEGILLGGGYGRGEGGVLPTPEGDRPYNDMEFYVLVRGSTVLNDRRYRADLAELAHALADRAGIEVEFKVISTASLRRDPVTMFSYDLVRGHRRVQGPATLLAGCAHHERAENIPLAEATRLLMNRGTGLLFSRRRLAGAEFTGDDADFVERNLAKARLALGDAVLTAFGQYHWSCRERSRRMVALAGTEETPWLDAVRTNHAGGVGFKLRPRRSSRTAHELGEDLRRITQLMCRVWLWLESRRLEISFRSPITYALHPAAKCPETRAGRNWLVNARRFGPRELVSARAFRYPRERLFRALPVLLWQPATVVNSRVRRRLQHELRTNAGDQTGLLDAYIRLWEIFR
jgi:hypothetical protein